MKGYSSIVRYKFNAGILLGMLAALVIVLTDITTVHVPVQEDIVSQTASDQDSGEDQQISAGKDLVATVSQLTLHHAWHFIASIYTDEGQDQDTEGFEVREYNSWFRTLFRLIISPNAP